MGLPTYGPKNVGTVFTAAAMVAIKSTPVEQFHVRCPALDRLRSKKLTESGGQTLTVDVKIGQEPLGGFIGRTGTMNIVGADPLTQAHYQWAFCYEPILVYHQDYWVARGKGTKGIMDLTKTMTDAAMGRIQRKIAQSIYSTTAVAGEILGLPFAITTTPASDGAYGNLDGSSSAQGAAWRNYSAVGGSVSTGACTDALTAAIADVTDKSTRGAPSCAFTDPTTWGYLEKYARSFKQITIGATTKIGQQYADMGYAVLSHMGVDIVRDQFCTSGVIYGWHDEALQMIEMKDCQFSLHPDGFVSKMADGQMAWVSALIYNAQMVCDERRAAFKLTACVA